MGAAKALEMSAFHPLHDATPDHVAALANQKAKLPRLALLGVFGTEATPGALIRTPDGKVHRVAPGDRIANRTVAAIGADKVMLSNGGATKALRMPKS